MLERGTGSPSLSASLRVWVLSTCPSSPDPLQPKSLANPSKPPILTPSGLPRPFLSSSPSPPPFMSLLFFLLFLSCLCSSVCGSLRLSDLFVFPSRSLRGPDPSLLSLCVSLPSCLCLFLPLVSPSVCESFALSQPESLPTPPSLSPSLSGPLCSSSLLPPPSALSDLLQPPPRASLAAEALVAGEAGAAGAAELVDWGVKSRLSRGQAAARVPVPAGPGALPGTPGRVDRARCHFSLAGEADDEERWGRHAATPSSAGASSTRQRDRLSREYYRGAGVRVSSCRRCRGQGPPGVPPRSWG